MRRRRRLGLGVQLGIAFAAVAAFTAILAAVIVAQSWQGTFDDYVRERVRSDANLLADAASRSYAGSGMWRRDALIDIGVFGASRGLRVQVLDAEQKVILDSADQSVSSQFQGMPMMTGSDGAAAAAQTPGSRMREPIVQVPVYVHGVSVGAVRVSSVAPGTFLTDRDVAFRASSSSGLAIAALLAVALATAGGVVYSRVFTRPIERLTGTAAALRAGNLDSRTGMEGEDQLGVLGRTLDEMADSMAAEREFERRLTADVAHELRTPLQAIQATVEAMQDGVLPADPEHLGVVRDETVRLARLADSILDLSRLENRSAPMRSAPIDPATPLTRSIETHRALFESLELHLVEEIEEGATVLGDADRLTQAFGNLLSNAARYTPAGGTVTVGLKVLPDEVHVSVSDTGIGLKEADRGRAFARFWRSDAARERSRTGFGIGLAVVREIVGQHDGTVALVANEPAPGTTVTVTLPTSERPGWQRV